MNKVFIRFPSVLDRKWTLYGDCNSNSLTVGTQNSTLATMPQRLPKEIERKLSSIQIDYVTEKSPGKLKSVIVAQTPLKNDQLELVWKTR